METIKIVALCLACFSVGYNICNLLWEILKSRSRQNANIDIDENNDETQER